MIVENAHIPRTSTFSEKSHNTLIMRQDKMVAGAGIKLNLLSIAKDITTSELTSIEALLPLLENVSSFQFAGSNRISVPPVIGGQ